MNLRYFSKYSREAWFCHRVSQFFQLERVTSEGILIGQGSKDCL